MMKPEDYTKRYEAHQEWLAGVEDDMRKLPATGPAPFIAILAGSILLLIMVVSWL